MKQNVPVPKKADKSVRVEDPMYSVNFNEFEFNGALVIAIDLPYVHYKDKLYAMVGDSCRGVISPAYFPPTKKYIFNLMIYSNKPNESNLHIEYYSYKKKTLTMYRCPSFVVDIIIGHPMHPLIIKEIK